MYVYIYICVYVKYQISTIVQKKKCWYPAPSQAELYNGTFYLFAVSVLGPQRVKAKKTVRSQWSGSKLMEFTQIHSGKLT